MAQADQSHARTLERHNRGMARLVTAVQELSLAKDLDSIMAIVRTTARELTGADGATFVLRDGDMCYYADEDAISPLWKGSRFPMDVCISGWVMLNRKTAVIEDIYADSRIPQDAYRPTFVKSLIMVPIRSESPIGAIGNYWARNYQADEQEVELLQSLADTTSVALENVQLYEELEQRVENRTAQLQAVNQELESFASSVSHDLRSPLNSINGYSYLLEEEYGDVLDENGRKFLTYIRSSTAGMTALIEDLLRLARCTSTELQIDDVNLGRMAVDLLAQFRANSPARREYIHIEEDMWVRGDPGLLNRMLDNLLSNAWKYTSKKDETVITVGSQIGPDGGREYFVRDNGSGFAMDDADKLFKPFQRLHDDDDFAGTGIGLATVHQILNRHGGSIRAEAVKGRGAAFFFTIPDREASSHDGAGRQ